MKIEDLIAEFNQKFGFLLKLGLDSQENFEKVKAYYIWKHLNS